MNVAVMQPYVFPYYGYFNLVSASDVFVFYDDVSFIKQGWINRNQILVSEKAHLFSIPVTQRSSFRTIKDTELSSEQFPKWRARFLVTLKQSYGNAPYFKEVFELVSNILQSEAATVSSLAINSVMAVTEFLGMTKRFEVSSQLELEAGELDRADRLVQITKLFKSDSYVNPVGGSELYAKEYFLSRGITLRFLKTVPFSYKQFNHVFIPNLSIIDVLMFNTIADTRAAVEKFELI